MRDVGAYLRVSPERGCEQRVWDAGQFCHLAQR